MGGGKRLTGGMRARGRDRVVAVVLIESISAHIPGIYFQSEDRNSLNGQSNAFPLLLSFGHIHFVSVIIDIL